MTTVKLVELWTDGACCWNPGGPGSWAAILRYKKHERELSGYAASTTNNRMELIGVLEGLKCLKFPCQVIIYSDSQYVVKCGSGKFKRQKNLDLWQQVDRIASDHQITWKWVKGHAGNEMNERCDALAAAELVVHRTTKRLKKKR